jgi:hypothetical protein
MKFKHLMDPGTALLIAGRWEYFQGKDGQQAGFFRFNNIELLSEIRDKRFRTLTLQMSLPALNPTRNAALHQVLLEHPGRLALKVEMWVPEDQRSVAMNAEGIKVSPEPSLFAALDEMEIGYALH